MYYKKFTAKYLGYKAKITKNRLSSFSTYNTNPLQTSLSKLPICSDLSFILKIFTLKLI